MPSIIAIWEQHNTEAHHPESDIHLAKEWLAEATRKLNPLKHNTQFNDWALIPNNEAQFIDHSKANILKQYITMNHKLILNSLRKAGAIGIQHTKSIVH